ncbi:sirohydrochlorin chelatase [Aquabacterium sp. OR-4]|uniref:sirohydrochlorin chelatase n=1 Tax=Aquabacterium sp. OR-4 TaxID=2978127 RepID=UPI0021B473E4|nr:CbiX/SirB N-terminal domain-containing protein [Aquabacterium sp. OR-4]MDT7834753.1 CbiX/SirB N-terminal domain-containing protein [Aquabacterium sp. OR-4]
MNTDVSAAGGLLLFAHGARDPLWARPFEAVARQCRAARGEAPAADGQAATTSRVALAFLEFMQPGLLAAGAQLAAAGCRTVQIVPLFLGAGGHVRKDLPALVSQLQAEHPEVQWQLRRAVGEADAVVQAMAAVALDAQALPEIVLR